MPLCRTHASFAGRFIAAALLPVLLASCAAERERQVAFSSWKQADPIPQAQVAQIPVVHEVRFAPADLQVSDIEREALYLFLTRTGVRAGDRVTVSVAIPSAAEATKSRSKSSRPVALLGRRLASRTRASPPWNCTPNANPDAPTARPQRMPSRSRGCAVPATPTRRSARRWPKSASS